MHCSIHGAAAAAIIVLSLAMAAEASGDAACTLPLFGGLEYGCGGEAPRSVVIDDLDGVNGPDLAVANTGAYLARLCREPRLVPRALREGVRLLGGSLRTEVDPMCENPCNCEAWLDVLFTGGEHANLEYYFRPLWGRFEQEEVDRAYEFIRKHVNKDFQKNTLSPLLKE